MSNIKSSKSEVIRNGFLDMQVCVPKDQTDEQVLAFANSENPSGLVRGWKIRKEGDELLDGDPERCQCRDHQENVHITLDV